MILLPGPARIILKSNGRHIIPSMSPKQRLYGTYHLTDDEIHFVTKCRIRNQVSGVVYSIVMLVRRHLD